MYMYVYRIMIRARYGPHINNTRRLETRYTRAWILKVDLKHPYTYISW